MTNHSRHTQQQGIVQGLVAEAIRCGADMIEVEYDEGYEEVYIRKDNVGFRHVDSKAAKAICCEKNSTAWRKRSDEWW